MRSPKLAALTMKRLFSDSLLVRAAVVAITLVPLLYGAMYLWAFWDPYGKLDRMPVALVNLDKPANVDAETISAGADLTRTLLETGTVEWHVVSADEASAGLDSGRYYLALTIPEEFSANLATANTKHPVRARLHVTAQESSNMLASQIASRVFAEIRAATGEDATKRYLDNIYVGFDDARGGFADAAAGARTLSEGLADARDGAGALAKGTASATAGAFSLAHGLLRLDRGVTSAAAGASTVASGNASLAVGLASASAGASTLTNGAKELAAGAQSADAGAASLADGSTSLAAGLSAADAGAKKVRGGASALKSGAHQLASAMDPLSEGADTVATSAWALASGAARLRGGVDDALGQLDDAATGAAQLESGASTLDSALRAYLNEHPEAADSSAFATALGASAKVKTGSAELASGLDDVVDGGPALAQGARQLAAGAEALHGGAVRLAAGLASADDGARGLAGGTDELATGASGLSTGISDAAAGAGRLAAGSASLASGTRSLSVGTSELVSGSAALQSGIRAASSGASELATGAAKLAVGMRGLRAGSSDAADGAGTLAGGLGQLDSGAAALARGLAPAVSGSIRLADGLAEGEEAVPAFSATVQEANAEMMSDPVALDTERRGEIPTYGTGFTPYFVPLALWVGALLSFFIVQPLPDRAVAAGAPAPIIALAGYLPAALIGVVQAVVLLAVVQLGLGLEPTSPFAFYGFGALTALVFVAILQMFNGALGTVGKLVSIVVLMLQLTSAGGTFPIQMVPTFFQRLSPYLPMTYVVSGLRQAISGGNYHALRTDSVVLVSFGAVSLLITIVAARRAQTYTMERLHPSLEL